MSKRLSLVAGDVSVEVHTAASLLARAQGTTVSRITNSLWVELLKKEGLLLEVDPSDQLFGETKSGYKLNRQKVGELLAQEVEQKVG